jgi:hypothetical protein
MDTTNLLLAALLLAALSTNGRAGRAGVVLFWAAIVLAVLALYPVVEPMIPRRG